MNLPKAPIIDKISNSSDLNRTQATEAVEILMETIEEGLQKDANVLITAI